MPKLVLGEDGGRPLPVVTARPPRRDRLLTALPASQRLSFDPRVIGSGPVSLMLPFRAAHKTRRLGTGARHFMRCRHKGIFFFLRLLPRAFLFFMFASPPDDGGIRDAGSAFSVGEPAERSYVPTTARGGVKAGTRVDH